MLAFVRGVVLFPSQTFRRRSTIWARRTLQERLYLLYFFIKLHD